LTASWAAPPDISSGRSGPGLGSVLPRQQPVDRGPDRHPRQGDDLGRAARPRQAPLTCSFGGLLDIEGARREFDYQVGELAYWSPGNDIAIFYADDGQAIPQPGLVRLGTIDTGLEVMAAAGNDFEMSIEPLD
jgi:Cyclophilin-like family